ncbi:MAG: hypothetical protein A2020_15685 [Lentisphaerae bacterium GWF2_45_14]|nr:MAG: hypothetical protein A2020_15685 [Lentisphaerae bacterium GWF2_45_14]
MENPDISLILEEQRLITQVAVSIVFIVGGCSSTPLPPTLTTEELDFIRNHKPVNATVDVKEDSMYPAYSRQLYEALKEI